MEAVLLLFQTLLLIYLAISLRTQESKSVKTYSRVNPLLLDSCTLIDGRITALIETSLINRPIFIPSFIVEELRQLADGRDGNKRGNARRGLDNCITLTKRYKQCRIVETANVTGEAVDEQLVQLAKKKKASIVTLDSALTKIARLNNVDVINLNELILKLQLAVKIGDEYEIEIIKKGEQKDQAIGQLVDGTTVIVEAGKSKIGTKQRIIVTGSKQNENGRLVFAKLR